MTALQGCLLISALLFAIGFARGGDHEAARTHAGRGTPFWCSSVSN